MILIERHKCDDKLDAKRKEREYIESLKANLNMTIPLRTDKEYRQDNEEHIQEYEKRRYEQNHDNILQYHKESYQKNTEALKRVEKHLLVNVAS